MIKFTFISPILFWLIDQMYMVPLLRISKIHTIFASDWWNGQWFCREPIKSKHNTLFPKRETFSYDWSCKCIIILQQISKIRYFFVSDHKFIIISPKINKTCIFFEAGCWSNTAFSKCIFHTCKSLVILKNSKIKSFSP